MKEKVRFRIHDFEKVYTVRIHNYGNMSAVCIHDLIQRLQIVYINFKTCIT